MRRGHMAHKLRIAKPTIRDDDRREQHYAASAECCHASIEHVLHPAQFVTARSPRAWRVRTAAGFGVAFLIGCGTSHRVMLRGLSVTCGVPCVVVGPQPRLP